MCTENQKVPSMSTFEVYVESWCYGSMHWDLIICASACNGVTLNLDVQNSRIYLMIFKQNIFMLYHIMYHELCIPVSGLIHFPQICSWHILWWIDHGLDGRIQKTPKNVGIKREVCTYIRLYELKSMLLPVRCLSKWVKNWLCKSNDENSLYPSNELNWPHLTCFAIKKVN